ncbi:MAG TPA: aldehyde dehydrogenase family protein [Polyangiales bacterium]|nr:aldehyde dehydrogenase family protein [Polyangiales bacterium]
MPIVYGGTRVAHVSAELASQFRAGDALLVAPHSGELLHVPQAVRDVVAGAVDKAQAAFAVLNGRSDAAISRFFAAFAARLADDAIWDEIAQANAADVTAATARGRSTTRLQASERMRRGMIQGLSGFAAAPSCRGRVLETVEHAQFRVELVGAALGTVGFVFEGRPNVLADATGVLRGGNSVVFRIGSDALGTARSMMRLALTPALREAELPEDAVVLIERAEHSAGWALFSDSRLGLAVARGSGPAVATLGALAQQAGVPVSLHGTGGAWLVVSQKAQAEAFGAAVYASLDRKACNTLNTCCIDRARAAELVPVLLDGLRRAGERLGQSFRLHVARGSESFVPEALFQTQVRVRRAEGDVSEPQADVVELDALGREWEWEQTPEVTLAVVDDYTHAVRLFNRESPRFIASLISDDPEEHARFFAAVEAPFVGDALTRWVDGQYALQKPELGLTNWQAGRLFGRGGILTGDTVYTVRTRYVSRAP